MVVVRADMTCDSDVREIALHMTGHRLHEVVYKGSRQLHT